MYVPVSLWWLVLLGLVLLYWFDSLRAREAAIAACREICRQSGLQLLDQTVALASLSLRRFGPRRRLCRLYRFEVSSDGADRRPGFLLMAGRRVEVIEVDHGGGMTILYSSASPPRLEG